MIVDEKLIFTVVVWSEETGDFSKGLLEVNLEDEILEIIKSYEKKHSVLVVRIYYGDKIDKTYRSLQDM